MPDHHGAIVFDLDGTLIDSAGDLRAALNLVLEAEGAAPVSLAETRSFIGHGIPNLVRAARVSRGIDSARQEAMTAAMFQHYQRAPAQLSGPYPGVIDCLERLQALGHPLGLCTNKAMAPTRAILRSLGLERFFRSVIGGDSMPQKKPDPAPLLAAFAPLGPALLYVGDSEVDAETAAAAGIPFALHTLGYRHATVESLPHRIAFDDFAVLPGFVASLAAKDAPGS